MSLKEIVRDALVAGFGDEAAAWTEPVTNAISDAQSLGELEIRKQAATHFSIYESEASCPLIRQRERLAARAIAAIPPSIGRTGKPMHKGTESGIVCRLIWTTSQQGHPFSRIESLSEWLQLSRRTIRKYLARLAAAGIVIEDELWGVRIDWVRVTELANTPPGLELERQFQEVDAEIAAQHAFHEGRPPRSI